MTALPRPRTHCGASQRRETPRSRARAAGAAADHEDPLESAGDAAARELPDGCRSCVKLRIRLENEERARLKAQQQLLSLHAQNMLLRGIRREGSGGASSSTDCEPNEGGSRPPSAVQQGRRQPQQQQQQPQQEQHQHDEQGRATDAQVSTPAVASAPTVPKPQRCRPNSGNRPAVGAGAAGVSPPGTPIAAVSSSPGTSVAATAAPPGPLGQALGVPLPTGGSRHNLEEVGLVLADYRREVELLREALKERDQREAVLVEQQRRQREEHEGEKQAWEAQAASLLLEVHELEARNEALKAALAATASGKAPLLQTTSLSLERAREVVTERALHDDLATLVSDVVT